MLAGSLHRNSSCFILNGLTNTHTILPRVSIDVRNWWYSNTVHDLTSTVISMKPMVGSLVMSLFIA